MAKIKKKKKKTITSADENAESLEPLKLLMGLCNSASTLENSLEVSQNLNHSYWPRNFPPRYMPRRNEGVGPRDNLCAIVHSGVVRNSQSQKQTKCPSLNDG